MVLIHTFQRLWRHFCSDSLFRNSIYLMATTAIQAVFGALFWVVCSHIYDPDHIGLSTALISVMSFIGMLGLVGVNTSFVRYLPTSKTRNQDITTGFLTVIGITLIITTLYILAIDIFSPKLNVIRSDATLLFLFYLSVITTAVLSLSESVFLALRTAKYIAFIYLVFSIIKIAGAFLFQSTELGPYLSFVLAATLTLFISLYILWKYHTFQWDTFSKDFVRRVRTFATSNYATALGSSLPASLLPIIILNKLGTEQSAYYYMAMMIANMLYVIPSATSQSLFAEGSQNPELIKKHLRDAYKIIAGFMIPTMICIMLFGGYMLTIFGKEYAENGLTLLRLLTVAGLCIALNYTLTNVLRIRLRLATLFWVNSIGSILKIALTFMLIHQGLFGVGLAWLISEALATLMFVSALGKDFFKKSVSHT